MAEDGPRKISDPAWETISQAYNVPMPIRIFGCMQCFYLVKNHLQQLRT